MKKCFYSLVMISAFTLAACSSESDQVSSVRERLACDEDTEAYVVEDKPIGFCYETAWGEPTVTKLWASQGELYRIAFVGDDETGGDSADDSGGGLDGSASRGPEIFYESYDFAIGDGDIIPFCFDCLRITAPDASLKEQIAEELRKNSEFEDSDLKVRKDSVGGRSAIRVHVKYTELMGGGIRDRIIYYIPVAINGYHMTISSDASEAVMIDNFAYDVKLEEFAS